MNSMTRSSRRERATSAPTRSMYMEWTVLRRIKICFKLFSFWMEISKEPMIILYRPACATPTTSLFRRAPRETRLDWERSRERERR